MISVLCFISGLVQRLDGKKTLFHLIQKTILTPLEDYCILCYTLFKNEDKERPAENLISRNATC